MSRPSMKEIIEALRKAGTVEGAARLLGLPAYRVRLYATGLAASGVIGVVGFGEKAGCGDCSRCPLAGLCGYPRRRQPERPSPSRGRRSGTS